MQIAYLLVFAVIVFMLWTTFSQQRKAKKAQAELIRMLKKGDEVLTIGGIFGVVRSIADDHVIIEFEDGGRAKLLKAAIRQIVDEDLDEYDDEDEGDEDDDEYVDEDVENEGDEDYVDDDDEAADTDDVELLEAPEAPEPPTPPQGGSA